MSRGTILYVGGFELPDLNAAAQRVLANALIFRDLGYRVGLIGVTRREGAPALGRSPAKVAGLCSFSGRVGHRRRHRMIWRRAQRWQEPGRFAHWLGQPARPVVKATAEYLENARREPLKIEHSTANSKIEAYNAIFGVGKGEQR